MIDLIDLRQRWLELCEDLPEWKDYVARPNARCLMEKSVDTYMATIRGKLQTSGGTLSPEMSTFVNCIYDKHSSAANMIVSQVRSRFRPYNLQYDFESSKEIHAWCLDNQIDYFSYPYYSFQSRNNTKLGISYFGDPDQTALFMILFSDVLDIGESLSRAPSKVIYTYSCETNGHVISLINPKIDAESIRAKAHLFEGAVGEFHGRRRLIYVMIRFASRAHASMFALAVG